MEANKEALLQSVAQQGESYRQAQEAAAYLREQFVDAVKSAHRAGATQLEIAERTQYSRQRIAQFLKERESIGVQE
jgi:hypothetical protein